MRKYLLLLAPLSWLSLSGSAEPPGASVFFDVVVSKGFAEVFLWGNDIRFFSTVASTTPADGTTAARSSSVVPQRMSDDVTAMVVPLPIGNFTLEIESELADPRFLSDALAVETRVWRVYVLCDAEALCRTVGFTEFMVATRQAELVESEDGRVLVNLFSEEDGFSP